MNPCTVEAGLPRDQGTPLVIRARFGRTGIVRRDPRPDLAAERFVLGREVERRRMIVAPR